MDAEVQAAVDSARSAQKRSLETTKAQVAEALEALPSRIRTYRSIDLAHELDRVSDLLKKQHWAKEWLREE